MKEKQLVKLVEAMSAGDDKAFEKLYKETSKNIYFICMGFLHNEEEVKDIMQETYISAYQNIHQLNEKDKFLPWLSQIAVNKCKRHLMKNTPVLLDEQEFANVRFEENENFLPEEYIAKKEKRKVVMDIMRESLSDIQYQTVILYYFNGLSVYEVADIMECPPGTVTYRLSVARAKIKDGVMAYENKYDEKLYSSATLPFLASLFAAEASGMQVPNVFPEIVATLSGGATTGAGAIATATMTGGETTAIGTTAANTVGGTAAKTAIGTAAKTGLGALKAKIALGLAATAIAGAGAVAIIIHNTSDDKKEPTYYERFEERSCEELLTYFEDEYGYGAPESNTEIGYDGNRTFYHREIYNEDETIWLQLEAYDGNDMPRTILFAYDYENEDTYREEWIESASFLCVSDEEKEELRALMNGREKATVQIGEYTYKFFTQSTPVGENLNLAIYLNWDGGSDIIHNNDSDSKEDTTIEQVAEYPTASELRDRLVSELGYTYCSDEDRYVFEDDKSMKVYVLRFNENAEDVLVEIGYYVEADRPYNVMVSSTTGIQGNHGKMLETLKFVVTTDEARTVIDENPDGTPLDNNGFNSYIELEVERVQVSTETYNDHLIQELRYNQYGNIDTVGWKY